MVSIQEMSDSTLRLLIDAQLEEQQQCKAKLKGLRPMLMESLGEFHMRCNPEIRPARVHPNPNTGRKKPRSKAVPC